ncbi:MAG: hypothetical protein ACI9TH_003539 [Kiritimatiellia bacterium]|jgi:hypothetical protein
MEDLCELCGRNGLKLTRHHLIPQCRHRKKRNRKTFTREEVQSRVLWICRMCHNQLHAVLSEKEMELEYNTREKLLAHPDVARFVTWVQKRNLDGRVPVRKKKRE